MSHRISAQAARKLRKGLIRHIMAERNRLSDMDYFVATLGCRVAPTIAGVKPATLLSLTQSGRDLCQLWDQYGEALAIRMGLGSCQLNSSNNGRLLMFYHAKSLIRTLYQKDCAEFLGRFGYGRNMELEEYFSRISKSLKLSFPHEIGVFLGIPVRDVTGFIENRGKNYIMNGYWKVYHNPGKALRMFWTYDMTIIQFLQSFSIKI